jgi:hypothetical protein
MSRLATGRTAPEDEHMANPSNQDAYNELAYYTLAHSAPSFIHQHIVDAFMAQHADEHTKPIAITFALVGLYLHIETGSSGKQVQQAHMQLAKRRRIWLTFKPLGRRGDVTVQDALAAPPGQERDNAIRAWCGSVWEAWKESQQQVRDLVKTELGID